MESITSKALGKGLHKRCEMLSNLPDDWGTHYRNCGYCGKRYHASEGGCDCHEDEPNHPLNVENSNRPYLADRGYELVHHGVWSKIISHKLRTCRRDHADGTIKKGQKYAEIKTRYIQDDTGESYIEVVKETRSGRLVFT